MRGASVSNQESPMVNFFPVVASRAVFAPDKMRKVDCFETPRLLVGLNCFEPGQTQKVHAHEGADKFYLVLSGKATVTVGDETREVGAGDLVFAPEGVPHGVLAAHERTVMLIGITRQP
ncbi:MAG: cupin domain-containing protein [Gemmatimonadales bacterium]|nr:cupin domain-containing protein [Gemmatimonadales bacterium]